MLVGGGGAELIVTLIAGTRCLTGQNSALAYGVHRATSPT